MDAWVDDVDVECSGDKEGKSYEPENKHRHDFIGQGCCWAPVERRRDSTTVRDRAGVEQQERERETRDEGKVKPPEQVTGGRGGRSRLLDKSSLRF